MCFSLLWGFSFLVRLLLYCCCFFVLFLFCFCFCFHFAQCVCRLCFHVELFCLDEWMGG